MDSAGHYRRKHPRRAAKKCAQLELLEQFTHTAAKAKS
jgi:hypothetical protein